MIVRHRDKARAVFAAHSHYHSVMRVYDPRGPANDGKSLPFEADGVFQFDAGGAGNSADGKITVITFFIDGQSVRADVVQSKAGTARFSVTGRYVLSGSLRKCPSGQASKIWTPVLFPDFFRISVDKIRASILMRIAFRGDRPQLLLGHPQGQGDEAGLPHLPPIGVGTECFELSPC